MVIYLDILTSYFFWNFFFGCFFDKQKTNSESGIAKIRNDNTIIYKRLLIRTNLHITVTFNLIFLFQGQRAQHPFSVTTGKWRAKESARWPNGSSDLTWLKSSCPTKFPLRTRCPNILSSKLKPNLSGMFYVTEFNSRRWCVDWRIWLFCYFGIE